MSPVTLPHRLTLVITELEVGGAERCLVQLVERLDRNRFTPHVVSLAAPPAPPRDALVARLRAAEVPVTFLGLSSRWQLPAAISQLAGQFRQLRPQLVQTFLYHANIVGTWAARRAGVPKVVTGVRVADPSRTRHWLERRAFRDADRVVCVSQAVRERCLTWGCGAPEQLLVIPNGIEVAAWQGVPAADLTPARIPANRRLLMFIGRLDQQKGLDWLLPVLPPLLEQFPQCDLALVGRGREEHRLRRLAMYVGISDRVHFLGWRSDVPALLARSEVVVLPSRWEGMPNVVLEAMASSRPVVATRVEGICELLGDGPEVRSQCVPAGDASEFLRRLASILHNPSQGIELGISNQRRVATHYSLQAMVARYVELYDQLLDGSQ